MSRRSNSEVAAHAINQYDGRMAWWIYALLSAACWGAQYVLMETLFRKVDFAAAFSFLSLANGLLVAAILWMLYPRQNWAKLGESWPIIGLVILYLIFGTGAYLFNGFAINQKNATLASLLEISYPLFIILFSAVFLREFHLSMPGLVGAGLILMGCLLVIASRAI
jgi:drug/metabolite transporter (DMT)-like permease